LALFQDYPGKPVPEEKLFLDFMWCKGRYQKQTHQQSAGHHSIRTNQRPTSLIPPPIFMPDALPAATLPIYLGLGQAPNMLACIPVAWLSQTINSHKWEFFYRLDAIPVTQPTAQKH